MKSALKKITKFAKDETVHLGFLLEKPVHMIYLSLVATEAHNIKGYAEAAVLLTVILSFFHEE